MRNKTYNQLDKEQFIQKARVIHGDKYGYGKVNYVNNRTPVILICRLQGHGEFLQRPDNHLSGKGCRKCGEIAISISRKNTQERILIEFIKTHKNKYGYGSFIYNGFHKKGTITCFTHGDFEQSPANHIKGHGCPKCGNNKTTSHTRYSKQEFENEANKVHNGRYGYGLSEYINSIEKICIICPAHGQFWQSPIAHLNGQGCPNCSSSLGEKLIKTILEKNNIKFLKEYKLPETPNYRYRYDFYLPDYHCLIEFHGRQHYFPIEFFGGEDAFRETVRRDKFKKMLARTIKYNILYFSYKDIEKRKRKRFKNKLLKKIISLVKK